MVNNMLDEDVIAIHDQYGSFLNKFMNSGISIKEGNFPTNPSVAPSSIHLPVFSDERNPLEPSPTMKDINKKRKVEEDAHQVALSPPINIAFADSLTCPDASPHHHSGFIVSFGSKIHKKWRLNDSLDSFESEVDEFSRRIFSIIGKRAEMPLDASNVFTPPSFDPEFIRKFKWFQLNNKSPLPSEVINSSRNNCENYGWSKNGFGLFI